MKSISIRLICSSCWFCHLISHFPLWIFLAVLYFCCLTYFNSWEVLILAVPYLGKKSSLQLITPTHLGWHKPFQNFKIIGKRWKNINPIPKWNGYFILLMLLIQVIKCNNSLAYYTYYRYMIVVLKKNRCILKCSHFNRKLWTHNKKKSVCFKYQTVYQCYQLKILTDYIWYIDIIGKYEHFALWCYLYWYW